MEKTLKDLLENEKNRLGSGASLTFLPDEKVGERGYIGNTDLNDNIVIGVDGNYQWLKDEETTVWAKEKTVQNPQECIALYLLHHELSHSGIKTDGALLGCPFDRNNRKRMYDKMEPALIRSGGLNSYLAGFTLCTFEDLKVNLAVYCMRKQVNGEILILKNRKKPLLNNGNSAYSSVDEALIKLLMHCINDEKDVHLFRPHFSDSEMVNRGVEEIIDRLSLPKGDNILKEAGRLFNPDLWLNEIEAYAEVIGKLAWKAP